MRKKFVVALLCVALSAFSAGAAEPEYGGVLVWREISEPPALDPAHANIVTSARGANLYSEPLAEISEDGQTIVPMLAESWEANEDSSVWTFRLRRGVKFQKTGYGGAPTANGGREVVASDVKFSFERLLREKSARAYFLNMIRGYQEMFDEKATEWAGVEVVDDHTVRFTLSQPYAPFLAAVSYTCFYILPREDVEKLGKDFGFRPVGTGPFIVDEWLHDNRVVYKKNPDYWMKDSEGRSLPYLDGVEIVIIPDNSVAFLELRKGNIDVLPDAPNEFHNELLKNFGDQYQRRATLGTQYYGMLTTAKPFDDVRVRQAFNYAINREAINELVLNGTFIIGRGVLPPGMPGYNPDLESYGYDPDRAKALLKEAGYATGLTVTLQYNNNPRHKLIGEAVQAQFAEIGVKVELQAAELGAHYDGVRRGDVAFFRAGWAGDYPDPDNFLYNLLCSDNFGAKGNYVRYKNDDVDAWLKEARRVADPAKRMELYRKAEQQIVKDAPWMFLFYDTTSLVANPGVRNIRLSFMGYHQTPLTQVWKTK
ncbi:MAG: ABC transporter substrate-binding protein [Synergistaceae bacterium]|jgi:peptide/nickel transport system substrate-binding protein/oligopeptide transport system substrate-binding protein|nr:ABC transporter substrate-binding protein [Synergistaceae bacterium]